MWAVKEGVGMKILNVLLLDKEARLFDTKEFLIKVFVAVILGFTVGELIPYVSGDKISLLFGMILTIEPVNMAGIRSGLKQVEATVIGAAITGVILFVFGYSMWTAALSICATLYVSLLIDWRNFSVVAVFTAIYMNTFIQLDALGNNSQIETFKLRIAALMTGVAIAFVVNWLFSVFGYRHMLEKRVYHILDQISQRMQMISEMLKDGSFEKSTEIMRSFPGLFGNVDWIYGTAVDLEKDPLVKRNQRKHVKLEKIMKMTNLSREMLHINYDICYRISKGDHHFGEEEFIETYDRTLSKIELLKDKLDLIIKNKPMSGEIALMDKETDEISINEIIENIGYIDSLLDHY